MFGEFNGDDYDYEQRTIVGPVLFLITTAIMPMILLNLVIAIMSDTYEKVMTSTGDSDNK
jgi:hypothetical protein